MSTTLMLLVLMAAADRPAAPAASQASAVPSDFLQVLLPSAVWAGSELVLSSDPSECRWCGSDAAGSDTLNGFDRRVRDALVATPSGLDTTARASDILLYGLMMPTSVLYPTFASPRELRIDAMRMALWSQALTALATSATKRIIRRERPSAHFGTTDVDATGRNTSFFSGHTSGAFASVFSMVQTCRLTGCRGERWMWIAGLPAATAVGTLRIRSDKHYATDVLAGAAVGAAIGWFTPKLIRAIDPRDAASVFRPSVTVSPVRATASWRW